MTEQRVCQNTLFGRWGVGWSELRALGSDMQVPERRPDSGTFMAVILRVWPPFESGSVRTRRVIGAFKSCWGEGAGR